MNIPDQTMDLAELREFGYLQEANRRFFHPLGLALGVRIEEGAAAELMLIDFRDDVEGVYYFDDDVDGTKRARVAAEWVAREGPRRAKLGYMIQGEEEE